MVDGGGVGGSWSRIGNEPVACFGPPPLPVSLPKMVVVGATFGVASKLGNKFITVWAVGSTCGPLLGSSYHPR